MSNTYVAEGRVVEILPVEQIGSYSKQSVVLETLGEYPDYLCIDFWGGNMGMVDSLFKHQIITVYFKVKSKPYKDKFFTNLTGQKVEIEEEEKKKAPEDFFPEGFDPETGTTVAKKKSMPRPKRKTKKFTHSLDDEEVPF